MTLLLMAGTGEARQIASALKASDADFTIWLPRDGRLGRDWPGDPARGALADCLRNRRISAVLDASHPFATDTIRQASQHSGAHGLPYCLLWRPEWRARPGDRWTHVDSEAAAARHISPGATIFAATGRDCLTHFAALGAAHVYCRQIGAPDAPFPFAGGEYLIQQPPFSVEDETAMFRRLGIDWLVLRNTGSTRAETKLTAARHLSLNVLMVNRPAPPDTLRVASVAEALTWAQAQ